MIYNDTELEVIFIKVVKEYIDEMVNFEIGSVIGNDPHSQFQFLTMTHKKFFNIILVDFLSCSDKNVLGVQSSYLSALKSICDSPKFDQDNSIFSLKKDVINFIQWISKEVMIEDVWLPSINLEINLSIKRIEFIKICGNISKHNFSRLAIVIKDLQKIFKRNGVALSDEQALVIIDDFYEWFHGDIFSYHSSAIAEFLNNIRWGIYEYLQPEFRNSIVFELDKDISRYHYVYPEELKCNFAKNCYWELMNDIRSKPCMKKFYVTEYLKMRY